MTDLSTRYAFDEAIANLFSNQKYANSYLFYGHMLGQCRTVFDNTLKAPAGINFQYDHYNLYINLTGYDYLNEDGTPVLDDKGAPARIPGFAEFTLEQRMGILKHEMLHILNGHIARKGDRDHQAFNIATDCAINQLIERTHLPEWCVFPDQFNGGKVPPNLTAEQYYELIEKKDGKGKGVGKGKGSGSGSGDGPGNGQGPNGDGTLDDHSKWDESAGDKELQDDITKGMIDRSITNTQKSRGNIPSNISDWLSLVTHKRELDWRKVLKGIVGNKKVGIRRTIMRQDRRLPNSEWIKGKTKNRMFDLLIISDVSGSVSDQGLLSLWGEVRNICDITQSSVNLIQVDSRPCAPEKLTKNTKTIERKACGGTVMNPALKMAKKHKLDFNAIVVTTDGYLDTSDVEVFAALHKRVIWLIEPSGQIMPEMNQGLMQAFKLKN